MKIFNLLFTATATFSTVTALADTLKVDVFNVGPGNCIVVSCPNTIGRHRAVVLDCGTSRLAGPEGNVRDVVSAKVKNLVEDRETDLIITHPNADHANIVATVFDGTDNDYQVENVFFGGRVHDFTNIGGLLSHIQLIAKGNIYGNQAIDEVEVTRRGKTLTYKGVHEIGNLVDGSAVDALECGGAKFHFLNMDPTQADDNERSLVTLLEYKGFKILFPGDGMVESLEGARLRAPALMQDIDVVVAPHHGAYRPSAADRMQALAAHMNPNSIIFSAGEINGHPRTETFDLYKGFLGGAPEHEILTSTGARQDYTAVETDKLAFTTFKSRDITVEVDGHVGGATLSWKCTGEDWCRDELVWDADDSDVD